MVQYKWVALSNTTLGVLMASINGTIVLISLPAIFRGIDIDPLTSFQYLLWIFFGYSIVTATLLVTFGRLSDMYGRVRLYNLGFAIFTVGSILLFLTPSSGSAGALELIFFRILQGIEAAFLFANSAAILTDAFPIERAREGPRHQSGRRPRGVTRGADRRRRTCFMGLEVRLLGQRPRRGDRHRVVLPQAQGARDDQEEPTARRPGERDLWSRAHRSPGGRDLRAGALRELSDGLGRPVGDRGARGGRGSAGRIPLRRVAR